MYIYRMESDNMTTVGASLTTKIIWVDKQLIINFYITLTNICTILKII